LTHRQTARREPVRQRLSPKAHTKPPKKRLYVPEPLTGAAQGLSPQSQCSLPVQLALAKSWLWLQLYQGERTAARLVRDCRNKPENHFLYKMSIL
jgi:hypothetical protein